jgi:hypothetical protein
VLSLGLAVSSGRALDRTPPARALVSARAPEGALRPTPRVVEARPARELVDHSALALLTPPTGATRSGAPVAHGADPALVAARAIARRVRGFRSFRSEIPLASWRTEPATSWQVRSATRCLGALGKQHLPVVTLERALSTPVPAPVVVQGPVGGVRFRAVQSDREVELSCELASRLPALAALLTKHGVRTAHVNSSYREQPRVSFHTFGLALDIAAFETNNGPLVVATDFELSPDVSTCDAKPESARGRALLALACDLAASGLFSSVLTPNYNAGHRDHFHLDIRPDDPRMFVR